MKLHRCFQDWFTALLILMVSANHVSSGYALSRNKSCKEHPKLIGPCFKVHGRLAYYNGSRR